MIKNLSAAAAKAKKRIVKEDGTDKDTPVATAGGDDEDDESDSAPFDREAAEADVQKYETLWTEFGRALKLGARSCTQVPKIVAAVVACMFVITDCHLIAA